MIYLNIHIYFLNNIIMSIFSIEPRRKVRRSKFHLNNEVKTTARFGEFTPILCEEVLPGDTWKIQTEQFIRFAPTLAPVMHRINATLHYFFVPNRLLMREDWESFISPSGFRDEERQELPYVHFVKPADAEDAENSAYQTLCEHVFASRLLNHLGFNFVGSESEWLDTGFDDDRFALPLLPICAYWLIMQDYFLDENQNDVRRIKKELLELCRIGECDFHDLYAKNVDIDYSVFESDFNGDYPATVVGFLCYILDLCKRCYEKDYFTSALPSTQRGDEVTIGGVERIDNAFAAVGGLTTHSSQVEVGGNVNAVYGLGVDKRAGEEASQLQAIQSSDPLNVQSSSLRGTIDANQLAQVGDENGQPLEINPVTINELRRAVKLQEFLERSMRGGYRLIEQIFAHFGVVSSNKLLDRPQFLGGNINPVTVTEVTGTAGTDITHLGEYSGHLQSFGGSRTVKFRSEEHGWLFCFLSVVPRTNYCQGLPRKFQRHDRFDFAWPEFAHLGEQEVWINELYHSPSPSVDDQHETFGYQSRYAEYKYIPSQVSGDFQSSLDYWTMARRFLNKPTLSNSFLQVSPTDETNTDIFTVQDDTDYLYCQFYHKILAQRCLPRFGVPML